MKRYALIPLLSLFLLLSVGCGPRTPAGNGQDQPEITEPSLQDTQEIHVPSADGDGGGAVHVPPPEDSDPAGPQDPSSEDGDRQEEPDTPPADQPEPAGQPAAKPGAMVALTFDDGPHAEYTDQILDILEANGAKATFFEVGRNLYNDADAVRRAEAIGCEVGSHSYRHADLGKMSAESIAADLEKADAIFQEVLGHKPNLVRPPYGSLNNAVKYTTGRSIITWSIDTEDWLSRDVDKIMAQVKSAGDLSGQVILMHSTYATSVEAARQLVPWLMEQGYQLVTITELITQYYGDQVLPNGTYGYSYFKNGKDVILPPGQSAQPEQPVQPEQPAQPAQPAQPEQPVQPEQPDGSVPQETGAAAGAETPSESPTDGEPSAA